MVEEGDFNEIQEKDSDGIEHGYGIEEDFNGIKEGDFNEIEEVATDVVKKGG